KSDSLARPWGFGKGAGRKRFSPVVCAGKVRSATFPSVAARTHLDARSPNLHAAQATDVDLCHRGRTRRTTRPEYIRRRLPADTHTLGQTSLLLPMQVSRCLF
ncbi:unnamed protein product, partial [Ixodes pacificus]